MTALKSTLVGFVTVYLLFFPFSVFAAITFSIANPQNQNEDVSMVVSIAGLTKSSFPNGSCYLQGAIFDTSETRYFGYTKNLNDQWYEYNDAPTPDTIKSTFFSFVPLEGSWSGKLVVKINPNKTSYKGPGQYRVIVWRYTGNSESNAGDPSNTLTVTINGPTVTPIPSNTPQPSHTPTHTPVPTHTQAPSNTLTKTPTPLQKITISATPFPSISLTSTASAEMISETPETGQVLGSESTEESLRNDAVKPQSSNKPYIVSLIFVSLGSAMLALSFIVKRMMIKV